MSPVPILWVGFYRQKTGRRPKKARVKNAWKVSFKFKKRPAKVSMRQNVFPESIFATCRSASLELFKNTALFPIPVLIMKGFYTILLLLHFKWNHFVGFVFLVLAVYFIRKLYRKVSPTISVNFKTSFSTTGETSCSGASALVPISWTRRKWTWQEKTAFIRKLLEWRHTCEAGRHLPM